MIVNQDHPVAAARLAEYRARSPVIAELIACAAGIPDQLQVDTETRFLEFLAPDLPRLRMRVILQESESVMLFLYKKSTLAFSRDRFTYGAVIFAARSFNRQDFLDAVVFLRSNFHPDQRPAKLKRAFKYTIEE
jgi:hypothetical protein